MRISAFHVESVTYLLMSGASLTDSRHEFCANFVVRYVLPRMLPATSLSCFRYLAKCVFLVSYLEVSQHPLCDPIYLCSYAWLLTFRGLELVELRLVFRQVLIVGINAMAA